MKRIIICESGATKADWRVLEDGMQVFQTFSSGTNVSTMKMDVIASIIRETADRLPSGKYDGVYFYTAGVVTEEISRELTGALHEVFQEAACDIQNDLTAAARAVCGHSTGIAAILGTGSNSCLFDGEKIIQRVYSCGYILGDEGGGASLGKAFLADFVKGLLPAEIEEELVAETGLDYAKVVRKVYKEPAASAFMASFAPFIMKRIEHPYMYRLVYECLESFVVRSLSRYSSEGDACSCKVGVVGSFGCACQEILDKIGREHGLEFVKFLKSPVDELVKYHGI
jgi:N-acetylglucosamine kinase-like BadF-type ATPase